MIPDSFRAKRKEPFLRVMGKADWNDDAEELRNTMYRIFADAQRELSVLGSVDVGATNRASAQQCEERIKELRDRKSQLVWCQAILASLNYKTALPRTWRGLFALKRKESL
jgi:hypothetical protein